MTRKKADVTTLEERRFRAWQLHKQGLKQVEIAERLGVTQGAVSRWINKARRGGSSALRIPRPTGVPPKLPRDKQLQLHELLAQPPERYGLAGARWTRSLIGKLIRREFGVVYSDESVSYVLRNIGWNGRPLQSERRTRHTVVSHADHGAAARNRTPQHRFTGH